MSGPKVLFCDIETLPIEAYVWGLYDQNPGVNMMKTDWTLLSWAAKWQGNRAIYYQDTRTAKTVRDDRAILKGIWKLLDEADIVVWQNGKSFDHKKLNARFLLNGMKPPSPYKQIDTKQIAKRHFALTSNGLEYMSAKLNKKHRKDKHKKFVGFDLWRECLAGNPAAFKEMEHYNKKDVLSLEELYDTLQAWDQTIDFNAYREANATKCNCGSSHLTKKGFKVSSAGRFQQFQCQDCGAWSSAKGAKNNVMPLEKREALKDRAK